MYQCFKRQLKTPTCFGSFVIHHQGVLSTHTTGPKIHAAKHQLRTQKYHK